MSNIIKIYTGWDVREEIGWHVFTSSVLQRTVQPVSFIPLNAGMAGITRVGTNAFTYSRYLIPYLEGYSGRVMFVDGADMLCLADIKELWDLYDSSCAVQVVPHNYTSKNHLKYIGTSMEARNEDYPRKNWSSVMLMNCAHPAWRKINPDTIDKLNTTSLHRLSHIDERYIGFLPFTWNWLVGEYGFDPTIKLAHFTLGIPSFPYYKNCDYSEQWWEQYKRMLDQS